MSKNAEPSVQKEKAFVSKARSGKCVILCDHAKNSVPQEGPAIEPQLLDTHLGWDIGALSMARSLSETLNASLVYSTFSRLLIDPNRSGRALDSVRSDLGIANNRCLSSLSRLERLERFFLPYHRAIDRLLAERAEKNPVTFLASLHSFTPLLDGQQRPWHIGFFYEDNERDKPYARFLIESLRKNHALCIGDNQPYGPGEGKNYTLLRHAEGRNIPSVGIEIRNDLLRHDSDRRAWTERLAPLLSACSS